jgi:hypothetical protein
MIFSSSILKLNALAMWAPKTAFNEELVLSRLIAFAFSHSLGPLPPKCGAAASRQLSGVYRPRRERMRADLYVTPFGRIS